MSILYINSLTFRLFNFDKGYSRTVLELRRGEFVVESLSLEIFIYPRLKIVNFY